MNIYLEVNQKLILKNHNLKNTKVKKSPFQNVKVDNKDIEIVKIIGRGSFGKIALVKYKKDGNFYVMKNMRKDQIISEGLADNILLERNILMDGQSEFILTISFFYQTPQRIYFICTFVKGGDLFHKLKEDGFLKEELVKFYVAQIAVALQLSHDMVIVYRDLKPEMAKLNYVILVQV